jgi:hypothetical protein
VTARPTSRCCAVSLGCSALTQLPETDRDRVLVRTDAAGGTHAFLQAVTELGLEYSVGFAITAPIAAAVAKLRKRS